MAAVPSEARERLAEAIADQRKAEREDRQLRDAYLPSLRAISEAEDALARATKTVEAAMRSAADHRVAVLAGATDTVEAPPSVATARQAVQQADDELAAAKAASAHIDRRSREVSDELSEHRLRVATRAKAAAWAELMPQAHTLAAELQALQRALLDKAFALSFLVNEVAPWPLDDATRALQRMAMLVGVLPSNWSVAQDPAASASVAKLRAFRDTLMQDADAALGA